MIKILIRIITINLLIYSSNILAKQYPNISGNIIAEIGLSNLISTDHKSVEELDLMGEIQADFSLNINRNWSVKTRWQIEEINKRDNLYQNKREILSTNNRQISPDKHGLIIEELKINFENEDLSAFAGKFNPDFAGAWNKANKSSIFKTIFAERYQLTEKIGFGIIALFGKSELYFSTFFNDNTDLSNSSFNKRGRDQRNDIAGGNNSLSSYVVSFKGKDLALIEDLNYHLSLKKIDAEGDLRQETGYSANIEYLFPLDSKTSIIPFFEIVKTNNINGIALTNSLSYITSLTLNYSSWNFTISHFVDDFKKNSKNYQNTYIEYDIAYRFTKNIRLDASRIEAEENKINNIAFGLLLTYIKDF